MQVLPVEISLGMLRHIRGNQMETEIVTIDGDQFILVHPPECYHCGSGDTVWNEDGVSVTCEMCGCEFVSE